MRERPGTDSLIYAAARQVAATWYQLTRSQGRSHEDAREVGLMQAQLYLSDLGLVDAAARPHLEGAEKAIASMAPNRRQN